MISIIFGPGGSGKSAFQMHVVEKQLRQTKRNIVTNLAIDIPALNAELEKRYPNEQINLVERIRILNEEETKRFWLYRGPRRWVTTESEFGPIIDMKDDLGYNGVCFIIDEAGASGFSALGWASGDARSTRGVECAAYLDQQRKYGDDVFASTNGRTPNSIAKGFRDKAHFFIKLKNGYLHKIGLFKGPSKFIWKKYAEEPTNKSEPMAEGEFRIDGLMDCYHTEQGVGVIGRNADKGERATGLPMWILIPAACVLAVMCVAVPYAMAKGVNSFIVTKGEKATSAFNASVPGSGPKFGPDRRDGVPPAVVLPPQPAQIGPVGSSPAQPPTLSNLPATPVSQPPVTVLGVLGSVTRNRFTVTLSDGRTYTEEDTEVEKVGRSWVQIAGRKIYFATPAPAPVKLPEPAKN